jgi:hypothetical protein
MPQLGNKYANVLNKHTGKEHNNDPKTNNKNTL